MTMAIQTNRVAPSLDQQAAAQNLVRALEEAFNAKDADALGRSLSEDAVWTNGLGIRAVGRREIVELARGMMRRFSGKFARYEIAHLMPVGEEVCVVNVEQIPVDRAGRVTDEARGAPIFVIARGAEGWKVVAGQNTLVAYAEEEA